MSHPLTFVALYINVVRDGIAGITLHHTAEEAYAELADALRTGNEDEPAYADVPTELDDLIEWCEQRCDEQGWDWYCCDVTAPTEALVKLD